VGLFVVEEYRQQRLYRSSVVTSCIVYQQVENGGRAVRPLGCHQTGSLTAATKNIEGTRGTLTTVSDVKPYCPNRFLISVKAGILSWRERAGIPVHGSRVRCYFQVAYHVETIFPSSETDSLL